VPLVRFTGEPVYLSGQEPDAAEVAERIDTYWRPYHATLREEMDRIRALHGRMVLWEGHSIRGSGLPFLFDGRLPDLNLGTANGASCSPALQARIEQSLAAQGDYDWVANGRFKGGHITRHYADPGNGIQAVQLELSQRTYMDEDSFAYDDARAARLQVVLQRLLGIALQG
jgi:N-formylglutamate deformylase